jgi:hypothetical protein
LDVEHRIRRSALRENDVIYPIIGYRSAAIHRDKKDLRVKRDFSASVAMTGSL